MIYQSNVSKRIKNCGQAKKLFQKKIYITSLVLLEIPNIHAFTDESSLLKAGKH